MQSVLDSYLDEELKVPLHPALPDSEHSVHDPEFLEPLGLRAALQDALAIMTSTLPSIKKCASLARLPVSRLAARYAQSLAGDRNHAHHALAVTRQALESSLIVDVEGMYWGRTFGSADLVTRDGLTLVLWDLTADSSLLQVKEAALQAHIPTLASRWPSWSYTARSAAFPTTAPLEDAHDDVMFANPQLKFANAFSSCDEIRRRARAVRDTFAIEMKAKAVSATLAPNPSRAPEVRALSAVADWDLTDPDLFSKGLSALAHSCPRLQSWCFENLVGAKHELRGVPPPDTARPITDEVTGWVGAAVRAHSGEDGELIAFSTAERWRKISSMDERRDSDTVFRVKGAGSIDIYPSEQDLAMCQLAGRITELPSSRIRPVSSPERLTEEILAGEAFTRMLATRVSSCQGLVERAAAVLKDQEYPDSSAAGAASDRAMACFAAFATCAAGAMLSATSEAVNSSLISQSARGPFHIAFSNAGAVVAISKRCGNINHSPAYSRIIACNPSFEVPSSWAGLSETSPAGVTWSSRCLLATEWQDEWLGKAEAPSVMRLIAYYDGLRATDGSNLSIDELRLTASAIAAAALNAYRPSSVVMKLQRYFMLGSMSPVCDVDGLADKLTGYRPRYLAEACLVARMVLRAAAATCLRAHGTTELVVIKGPDGNRCTRCAPMYAASGRPTMSLVMNSFYDGDIGPQVGSNMALDDAYALQEAYEAAALYRDAMSSGLAYGASSAAVQAWRQGTLAEYASSESFEATELGYIRQTAAKHSFFGASLVLVMAQAMELAEHSQFRAVSEAAWHDACLTSVSELMTLKRAAGTDVSDLRAATTAYEAICEHLQGLVSTRAKLSDVKFKDIMRMPKMRASGALGPVMAATACGAISKVIIAIAKTFSIEKARDIVFLPASMRILQASLEFYMRSLSRANPGSAMSAKEKLDLLHSIRPARSQRGKVRFYIATDKSKYGTTKDTGAMVAAVNCLGLGPGLKFSFMRLLDAVASKRMRPSDSLLRLSPSEIDALRLPEGLRSLLAACFVDSQHAFDCPVGMGQGILQQTADFMSGLASTLLSNVLNEVFGEGQVALTTNDDGVIAVTVPLDRAHACVSATIDAAASIYSAFGEKLNKTKVFASPIVSELNTRMLVNGQRMLPWSRAFFSLANPVPTTQMTEAVYATMARTNGPIAEGAPAFAAYAACAMSWATHFQVFRFTAQAMSGEYLSYDPALLGKPVLAPFAVAAYGPAAVRAAEIASSGICTLERAVMWVMTSSLVGALTSDYVSDWKEAVTSAASGAIAADLSIKSHAMSRLAYRASKVRNPVSDESVSEVLGLDGTVAAVLLHAAEACHEATRSQPLAGARIGRALVYTRIASAGNKYAIAEVDPATLAVSRRDVSEHEAHNTVKSITWASKVPDSVREQAVYKSLLSSARSAATAMAVWSQPGRHLVSSSSTVTTARIGHIPVTSEMLLQVSRNLLGGITTGLADWTTRKDSVHYLGEDLIMDDSYASTQRLVARLRYVINAALNSGLSAVLCSTLEHGTDAGAVALAGLANIGGGAAVSAANLGLSERMRELDNFTHYLGSRLSLLALRSSLEILEPGAKVAVDEFPSALTVAAGIQDLPEVAASESDVQLSESLLTELMRNPRTSCTTIIANFGTSRRVLDRRVIANGRAIPALITRHCRFEVGGRVSVWYTVLCSEENFVLEPEPEQPVYHQPLASVHSIKVRGHPACVMAESNGRATMLCKLDQEPDLAHFNAVSYSPKIIMDAEMDGRARLLAGVWLLRYSSRASAYDVLLHCMARSPSVVITELLQLCSLDHGPASDLASELLARPVAAYVASVMAALSAALSGPQNPFSGNIKEPRSLQSEDRDPLDWLDFDFGGPVEEKDEDNLEELYGLQAEGTKVSDAVDRADVFSRSWQARAVVRYSASMSASLAQSAVYSEIVARLCGKLALASASKDSPMNGPGSPAALTLMDSWDSPNPSDRLRWRSFTCKSALLGLAVLTSTHGAVMAQERMETSIFAGRATHIRMSGGRADVLITYEDARRMALVTAGGTMSRVRPLLASSNALVRRLGSEDAFERNPNPAGTRPRM